MASTSAQGDDIDHVHIGSDQWMGDSAPHWNSLRASLTGVFFSGYDHKLAPTNISSYSLSR
jgi:hypothetical protein